MSLVMGILNWYSAIYDMYIIQEWDTDRSARRCRYLRWPHPPRVRLYVSKRYHMYSSKEGAFVTVVFVASIVLF